MACYHRHPSCIFFHKCIQQQSQLQGQPELRQLQLTQEFLQSMRLEVDPLQGLQDLNKNNHKHKKSKFFLKCNLLNVLHVYIWYVADRVTSSYLRWHHLLPCRLYLGQYWLLLLYFHLLHHHISLSWGHLLLQHPYLKTFYDLSYLKKWLNVYLTITKLYFFTA